MRNIRIVLEYQGTAYCGWQIQPNGNSIQEALMRALYRLTGETINVNGSGRTDAGVHARGQCASFRTDCSIPADKFARALNSQLPADIAVLDAWEEADEFHARFSALGKQYSYQLYIHPQRSALMREFAWQLAVEPDPELMDQALTLFTGTHDFAGFRGANSDVKGTERTVWRAHRLVKDDIHTLVFAGNGFLYKMVRMMTAAVVNAGLGKISIEEIARRLQYGSQPDQKHAAPPQGLFLDRVFYHHHETGEIKSPLKEFPSEYRLDTPPPVY